MWEKILSLFGRKNGQAKILADKAILLIDDGITERTFMSKILAQQGCRVRTAADGQIGLEQANSEIPDLIILDFFMPGLNGKEVCQRLKASDKTKAIPVVFLTGSTTPEDVVGCYDVGADYYLSKPISAKALVRQLELTFQELPAKT